LLIKICPTIPKAHPNSSYLIWIWSNIIFNKRIIQYSRTFTPQVQTSWNQTNAPLLVKSFPKIPWTQYQAPWFGGSHSYKRKQIVRDSPLSFVRKEVPCHNHGGWFTLSRAGDNFEPSPFTSLCWTSGEAINWIKCPKMQPPQTFEMRPTKSITLQEPIQLTATSTTKCNNPQSPMSQTFDMRPANSITPPETHPYIESF
jgi:hypothetical protein